MILRITTAFYFLKTKKIINYFIVFKNYSIFAAPF